MHTVAMISMKGHSVRVPRKNLKPLAGRPLFFWILDSLHGAQRIDQIVVESDSEEIRAAVKTHFPSVTLLQRPQELEGDDVSMNRLIAYNMGQVPADLYLQTHSTNPLLRAETIDRAVATIQGELATEAPRHDSLFGVTALQTRLYRRDGTAINHNPDQLIPTQNLPPVFEENSTLYLFTASSFSRRQTRIGTKPLMFAVDRYEATDIDTPFDFDFAEMLMHRRLAEASGVGRSPSGPASSMAHA